MAHMPGILDLQLDKIFFRNATKGTYRYGKLTEERTNWRIAQGHEIKERDIFGSLLAAHDAETNRSLTREELIAEAGLFIIAGSDTTGSAITATIFYLLHHEKCYKTVQQEVLSRFSRIEDIHSRASLQNCRYLQACVTEAMRLSPGVGAILPREVLDPGMKVDGIMFPPGTDVGVGNYAIHHNEHYYPDPFEFRPTRWLLASEHEGGVTPREIQVANSAYAPFSVGRANCLGRTLAYQEIMTVIARLVYQYEMRIQPGSTLGQGTHALGPDRRRETEFQTWDRFVSHHEGPMVEYRPRTV
jgi:cytochrome P450